MDTKRQRGVTLIELMFAIAILSIVLGVGVPSFIGIIQTNRMAALNNDVMTAIHRARSEAVKMRTNTVLCPTAAPAAAAPACGGTLTQGWVVFSDVNGNGAIDAPADLVLLTHEAILGNMTVNADGTHLSFASTGFAQTIPALGINANNVLICDDRGHSDVSGQSTARGIFVSPTGRPQVLRDFADVSNVFAAVGGC
ncbi:MAG: GspH/FimT family pseudopilin [Pseudomonadota bacterium]